MYIPQVPRLNAALNFRHSTNVCVQMAHASATSSHDYDLLLHMRKATRRAHHIANALILAKLVVVLTDRKLYAQALSSFLPVYSKLEQLMKVHAAVPGLSTVIDAVRDIPPRSDAMKSDLQHFLGSDWQKQVPASPEAEAYAVHLQHLADQDPLLLLPYVFSMHVPILLGFLGQRIQRSLQLPDAGGLDFFTVEDKAGKLAALRSAVRTAGRVIQPSKRQLLLDEAVEQFRRNNAVVASFSLGCRPILRALHRAVRSIPLYVYAMVVAVVVAACAAAY